MCLHPKITGESLIDGFNLESVDLTADFESSLFKAVDIENDVTISSDFAVTNAVDYAEQEGEIRFAAASLSDVEDGGTIVDPSNLEFDSPLFADVSFRDNDPTSDIVLYFKDQIANSDLDKGPYGYNVSQTYAYDENAGEYVSIDGTGLGNGDDYRGKTLSLSREYWINEWNGTDSLRFDISYLDNAGNEYFDHYYYDSETGFSNSAASKELAGEYDLNAWTTETIDSPGYGGYSADNSNVLASIKLDFNEDGLAALQEMKTAVLWIIHLDLRSQRT